MRSFTFRNWLWMLLLFISGITMAQTNPLLTLTAETDGTSERTLEFSASVEGVKLSIDWGDGALVETEEIIVDDGWSTTAVMGVPKGEGTIKIYGEDNILAFNCASRVDGLQITGLDVTKAKALTELTCNTNKLTTLDLSENTALTKLTCNNNAGITTLDLSANTELTSVDATNMGLTAINLSRNSKLTSLKVSGNPLGNDLDLSGCVALKSLYALDCYMSQIDLTNNTELTYVSLNNNLFTELDVTYLPKLASLFCMNNLIAELKADNVTKTLNCSNNCLTPATLPALPIKGFTYAPQKPMAIAETITVGESIDLSAQDNITGLAAEPKATVYTWKTEDGTVLEAGTDYNVENGVFTFLKAQDAPAYCEMTTEAFPKFSGTNAFKTTAVKIEAGDNIGTVQSNTFTVTATHGQIRMTGLTGGSKVTVYNMSGQTIKRQTATGSDMTITLTPGLYIVTADNNTCKVNAQ